MTTTYPTTNEGEPGVTRLYMEAVLDGSGDVSSYVRQRGMTSLTQSSTGIYSLLLRDVWAKFLGLKILFSKATDIAVRYQIAAEDVDGARTITIRFYNLSSPANLASPVSASIYIEARVSNVED